MFAEFDRDDTKVILDALVKSHEFFSERDLMNAAIHLQEVKFSPITELVAKALKIVRDEAS